MLFAVSVLFMSCSSAGFSGDETATAEIREKITRSVAAELLDGDAEAAETGTADTDPVLEPEIVQEEPFDPFSAIKAQVSPFSISIIDFYNADYVCKYTSSYGMLASVSYLRRFSEHFSLEGGLGYTLALQKGAVLPGSRDFHYVDMKVLASAVLPFSDTVDFSLGLGAGMLVHMGTKIANLTPEMLAHAEIDIALTSAFSLGAGFDFSLSFIPMEEKTNSSLTALIHPLSIVGEFML